MLCKSLLAAGAALAVCGSAVAADLPRRAAPPPVFTPVPVFTWTGFYAGFNAGYAFSDNRAIRTIGNNGPGALPLAPGDTNTVGNVLTNRRPGVFGVQQDGFTGGGQIGYNYQFTPGSGIVIGLEADAQYTDLDRSRGFLSTLNDPSTFRQSLDFLGTVRGRLGYAFDRFLVYGTGGFAYGSVTYDAQFFGNAPARPLAYAGRYSEIETGYAYGGGIEYAMPTDSFLNFFKSSAVTVKVEYLRYDLGSRNVLVNFTGNAPVNGSYTSRFSTEGNIVRAGLNYKFGSY
ncbi:MAG: porin family protein [Methylobacterium frigidaeris]